MKLTKTTAELFVPDGADVDAALKRTTHLGVGAHQDDLEFMAVHGILACFGQADKAFCGVTCTDGAGSSRSGVYASYTDEQMRAVRRQEQRTAAMVGRYGAMLPAKPHSEPLSPIGRATGSWRRRQDRRFPVS